MNQTYMKENISVSDVHGASHDAVHGIQFPL